MEHSHGAVGVATQTELDLHSTEAKAVKLAASRLRRLSTARGLSNEIRREVRTGLVRIERLLKELTLKKKKRKGVRLMELRGAFLAYRCYTCDLTHKTQPLTRRNKTGGICIHRKAHPQVGKKAKKISDRYKLLRKRRKGIVRGTRANAAKKRAIAAARKYEEPELERIDEYYRSLPLEVERQVGRHQISQHGDGDDDVMTASLVKTCDETDRQIEALSALLA